MQNRNVRMAVALIVGAMVLMAGCADDGGDETFSLSECAAVELPHPETPRIIPSIIVVDAATIDPARLEDFGRPRDLIEIVTGQLHEYPDGFSGERLAAVLSESPYWDAVAGRVALVEVAPAEQEATLSAMRAANIDVAPLHLVGYMGHWSAYPGTSPQKCTLTGELPVAESGESVVIGVVDTGLVPGSSHAATAVAVPPPNDVNMSPCDDVSHGEFVAEVIRRINPDATVVSANAFRTTAGSCWETTEAQLVVATTSILLEQADGAGGYDLDALNYSLGAEPHVAGDGEVYVPLLTRIAFEVLIEQLAGTVPVYAAAGNSDRQPSISPADLDGVISVAAADVSGDPTVWDEDGKALDWPFDPADVTVLGCDLVAVATGAGSPEVVLWSGSSFASPIAAAWLATADIPVDQVDLLMATVPALDSQCTKS